MIGLDPELDEDGDYKTCCGTPLRFDPESRGETCGGLEMVGWLACDVCNARLLCHRSRPAESSWKLAKGGRSLDTGGVRLRAEGRGGDVPALMARIARLPELEREVERLRAELAKAERAAGWEP